MRNNGSILDNLIWGILLLLLVPSGLAIASWNSLPGSMLFRVKLGSEQALLFLLPSHEAKSTLHVKLSERRFSEAKTLLSQRSSAQGLSYLRSEITATKEAIKKAPTPEKRQELARVYIETLRTFNAELEQQQQLMGAPSSGYAQAGYQPVQQPSYSQGTYQPGQQPPPSLPTSGYAQAGYQPPPPPPAYQQPTSPPPPPPTYAQGTYQGTAPTTAPAPTRVPTQPPPPPPPPPTFGEGQGQSVGEEIDDTQDEIEEAIEELEEEGGQGQGQGGGQGQGQGQGQGGGQGGGQGQGQGQGQGGSD